MASPSISSTHPRPRASHINPVHLGRPPSIPRPRAAVTSDVVERAGTRLGRTELAPVVDELFRRFGDGAAPSSFTLLNLDEKGQIAVADLLGESRLRATRRLTVGRLVEVLGLADADELRGVIELLPARCPIVGPIALAVTPTDSISGIGCEPRPNT